MQIPVLSFASETLPSRSGQLRKGCRRCEEFPTSIEGPGTLHLSFPLSHSRAKILNYLYDSPHQCAQNGDVLSVQVEQRDLSPIVAPLMEILTSIEQADVRVLFQARGQEMGLQDYFGIETLDTFICKTQSSWLGDFVNDGRLTNWFQPIVNLDDGSVFAYESLMRGHENGEDIYPDRILGVARGAGLLFQIDRAARLSSIRNAARHGLATSSTRIFINFMPTAIYDPVNCLSSTVREVDACGLKREQIVFEVVESEKIRDTKHLKEILDYYRAGGFGVALDDVGAGTSGLNLLEQIRPDYMKLDMHLTRDVHLDPYKATIASKLLEIAREVGVKTVCEGVENHDEVQWLRDNGADYAQGYFFGKPAPQIAT